MLAHTRLLSSEAKDWKSRAVSEVEQVLCQESAEAAQRATDVQEAVEKVQARWRQVEAELRDLRQSNSAQVQNLAARLRESELEHHQPRTAKEGQLQLEAQALRRSQDLEQQAASIAHEQELALRNLRKQAESQPKALQTQWRYQMSQQASYKAETHDLYTKMLNVRKKSELQAALSAKMCRFEPPSHTVQAIPDDLFHGQ